MAHLNEQQIKEKLSKLNGWEETSLGGQPTISRTYETKNFLGGLGFVTRIAVLAEKAGHHPDILLTYPKVTVSLTTHDAGGLTDKDFDMAVEIDKVTH